MPGYDKIGNFIQLAKEHGFDYVWADTVCIDKTNSTELFEAINSMFRWYAEAKLCYAYLADVESPADLSMGRWFRRDWTLQELLAPTRVAFYSSKWKFLGYKTRTSLKETLGTITGIPRRALIRSQLDDWSIAKRMSWASTRETKREEDRAYSLL